MLLFAQCIGIGILFCKKCCTSILQQDKIVYSLTGINTYYFLPSKNRSTQTYEPYLWWYCTGCGQYIMMRLQKKMACLHPDARAMYCLSAPNWWNEKNQWVKYLVEITRAIRFVRLVNKWLEMLICLASF